jgi:hypothetical protein
MVRAGERVSLIFPRVKRDKLKKNFSGKEGKSRRLAVKAPRKRPITRGNDTVIACIIPCKIRLNCLRVSVEQRVHDSNLMNSVRSPVDADFTSSWSTTLSGFEPCRS